MDVTLMVLAFALVLGGIAGSFLPVLPGPPLAFLGLAVLWFSDGYQPDTELLGMHLAAASAITALDYYVPIWGTKRFGGTKAGTRGATIGLLIGLFLGPLGIVFGPFFGALLGEMSVGTPQNQAVRAAFGAFLGFVAGVFMKLAYGLVVLYQLFQLL